MNPVSYHQTQTLTQAQLSDYERAARNQEEVVLSILRQDPLGMITAEELMAHFDTNVPITSIRRALTNLTLRGNVEKCGHVPGVYGRPITQYRCRRGPF